MSLVSDTVCWQRMKLLRIPFFDEHKLILHNSIIALWYDFDRNTLLFTRAIRISFLLIKYE